MSLEYLPTGHGSQVDSIFVFREGIKYHYQVCAGKNNKKSKSIEQRLHLVKTFQYIMINLHCVTVQILTNFPVWAWA